MYDKLNNIYASPLRHVSGHASVTYMYILYVERVYLRVFIIKLSISHKFSPPLECNVFYISVHDNRAKCVYKIPPTYGVCVCVCVGNAHICRNPF